MSDHQCSARFDNQPARRPRLATVLVMLVGMLTLASCGLPFTGGDDDGNDAQPQAETGDPSPTATAVPQPDVTVETNEDEWTVINGPDKADPPDARGEEQIFRMTGPTEPPSSIDPALVRDTSSAFLARQVFRGLTRLDQDLEPVPDLARRIEISPDGRTYRFQLHEAVTFHDGTPIGASDVKASLERALDPALAEAHGGSLPASTYLNDIQGADERARGERDDIPGIRVLDERELEIQLDRGVVDFLERLANPATYIVDVSSAEVSGDWWQTANGSGPFVLDEWDGQRQVRLVAHDGYVRPPELRAVEIRLGPEAVGEMRLYESGEIDMARVPLSVIDRVDYEGSPIEGDLRENAMLSTSFIMIDPNSEPFTDDRVRRALFRTFPRDDIPRVMLDQRAQEATGVIPQEMLDGESAAFPYEYDPDLARSLIGETELTEDDVVTIYSSGGGIPVALKHHIEETLGLSVEVVQLGWGDYIEDLREGELPMYVLTWVADAADPVTYLRALFHSESSENYSGFADEQVDELLDRAAVEQDSERRDELIAEAHQQIMGSAVVMPLYHGIDYTLVREHVVGLQTTPMGILGLESVRIEE